jgi:hypothetical protein
MSLDDAFALGWQKLVDGKPSAGADIFRQILRQVPNHAQSLHGLGAAALQTGRLGELIRRVGAALRNLRG